MIVEVEMTLRLVPAAGAGLYLASAVTAVLILIILLIPHSIG